MFYTYLWLREDGTPYYAGKGSGRRAFVSYGHGVHAPADKTRIVVMLRASETEAFVSEIELIRNWGRLDLGTGCLRNRTDGGENPPKGCNKGKKFSQLFREKCRQNSTGRLLSQVSRQKISDYQKTHDNPGRFRLGDMPAHRFALGVPAWNAGKSMVHSGSFSVGHSPHCNHLGGYKNGNTCTRCGKDKKSCE